MPNNQRRTFKEPWRSMSVKKRGPLRQFIWSLTLLCFTTATLAPSYVWAIQAQEGAVKFSHEVDANDVSIIKDKPLELPVGSTNTDRSASAPERLSESAKAALKSEPIVNAPPSKDAPQLSSSEGDQTLELPIGTDKSGVTSQTLALPQGAATNLGMGESFSTQASTGTATFTLPLVLLHARGAAQPSLGLSYSSGSGAGPAGVGWSIGESYIARQTDRGIPRYGDGATWQPNQDRFVFNGGQELVPICTVGVAPGLACPSKLADEVMPPWSAGHQYFRSRVEGSFVRFFWSPDHLTWRAQDKSGITMEFGMPLDGSKSLTAVEANPSKASEIYRWLIVRQYDTFGGANPPVANPTPYNAVVYQYSQAAAEGQAYLTDIYDTTPAVAPSVTTLTRYAHHTRLVWEPRNDPSDSYRSGWRIRQTLRLKRVDVTSKTYANGESGTRRLVRRYYLGYDVKFHASLLTSVTLEGRCGANESASTAEVAAALPEVTNCPRLPPIEFSYRHVAGYSTNGQSKAGDLPGYEAFDERIQQVGASPAHSLDEDQADFFDVNADGLPDVLVTQPRLYGDGFGVFFNSAKGVKNTFGSATSMSVGGVSGENAGNLELRDPNVLPLDLNGDGIVDLLHLQSGEASYSTYSPKQSAGAWSWDGRRITSLGARNPKLSFGDGGLYGSETRTADVNADGLIDVVVSTGTELQTFLSLGRLPSGEAQFGDGSWASASASTLSNEPIKTCLPAIGPGSTLHFSSAEYQFGDMNGDGLSDIVHVYHGDIRYWPGRGNGFWGTGERNDCAAGSFNERYLEMAGDEVIPEGVLKLDDINGDGLDDLIRLRFDGADIWLNVDGNSWTARHSIDGTPANPGFGNRVRLVDFNGSSTRDLVWGAAGKYAYADLAGGVPAQLLTGIKNGLGKTTTIEYSTSSQEMLTAEATGVACDATRKPWTSAWCSKMPTVVPVVKRVTESDNLSIGGSGIGQYVTEYTYRDPVYEGRQREFRGFAKARVHHVGDANSPSDNADTTFLTGECEDESPTNGIAECSLAERWRDNPREALKGLPVVTERYDDNGRYLSTEATSYRLRQLYTGLDGRVVRHAFGVKTRTTLYDTNAATTSAANDPVAAIVELESAPPAAIADLTAVQCTLQTLPTATVTTTRSQVVPRRAASGYGTTESSYFADAYGNRLIAVSKGCVAGTACPVPQTGISADEMICSFSTAVHAPSDPTGWLFRTDLSWLQGSTHAEIRNKTSVTYSSEGAPLKTQAWLAGSVPLARTSSDPLLTPAAPPPTVSLDASYLVVSERTYDTLGNVIQEKRPNGHCRAIKYEATLGALSYAQLPSREILYRDGCPLSLGDEPASALGTISTYDRGFGAMDSLTDVNVQRAVVTYDAFGRFSSTTKPLPGGEAITATTLPTQKVTYDLPAVGSGRAYSVIKTEVQDGADPTSTEYETTYAFIDGSGRQRLQLEEADATDDLHAWIVSGHVQFDAKGGVKRKYTPYFNDSTPPAIPIPDTPPSASIAPGGPSAAVASVTQRFDAFGRVIQAFDLDGTITLQKRYHALSTDIDDAADAGTGLHKGTYATTQMDGHGRTVMGTERVWAGSSLETRDTRTQYLTSGEPEVITRVHGTEQVVRWLRYDSLGRMVLNVDPHATVGFAAEPTTSEASLKTLRYAYDDVGDLVATTDARGCGANFYYDNLGRLRGEEYSPCQTGQAAVTPLDTATGDGFEVVYEYDEPTVTPIVAPPVGFSQDPLLYRGRLRAVHDRSASTLFKYDARGRTIQLSRKIARIATLRANIASRYVDHWYTKDFTFDGADRTKTETTGAASGSLLNASDGTSSVGVEYTHRGTTRKVTSSYGDLVQKITRTADNLVSELVYGDAANTTSHSDFDARRRVAAVQTYRAAAGLWSAVPAKVTPAPGASPADPTRQLLLQDVDYVYDEVSNVTEVRDFRVADDWPSGAKPVSRKMAYDDLYRLTRVDYQYPAGTDTFVSPYDAELHGTTDPRRPKPPGHKLLGTRPLWQTFAYDWLGNTVASDDDLHVLYDRSLGTITNDTSGKPYQISSTSQAVAGGAHNGSVSNLTYDVAGNLTGMQLTRSAAACATALSSCNSTFSYEWDEVGRLVAATRRDGSPPAATGVTLRYAYDSENDRVLKEATDGASLPLTTAYIFNTLELRRAAFDNGGQQYPINAATEVVYLAAAGLRLGQLNLEQSKGEPQCTPTALHAANLHVVLMLPDLLGSASIMIDQATGELVEARSYQPYGATESDYRPLRWQGFREDYGFSGKEEDVEVGLQYFGRRFLSPYLGRWISLDPLGLHIPGKADLNLYAYVSGRVLVLVDPLGLDPPKMPPPCVVPPPGTTNEQAAKLEKAAYDAWKKAVDDAEMAKLPGYNAPPPQDPTGLYWRAIESLTENGNFIGGFIAPFNLGPESIIHQEPSTGVASALGGYGQDRISDGGGALPDLPRGRAAPAPAPRGVVAEPPAALPHEGRPEDIKVAPEMGPPPPARGARSGGEAQKVGDTREAKVADITGGVVSRQEIKVKGLGKTDIDVVAKNGDLVFVGGPAKAHSEKSLANMERGLKIYQAEAAGRGVGVRAYFTSDTPQIVLDRAAKVLGGTAYVRTFTE
jgi:RHS repeat-associated protein